MSRAEIAVPGLPFSQIMPLLILLLAPLWGMSQSFTAFLNKGKVSTGEAFQVSFRLENAQGSNFRFPDFKGLQVLSGPNQSTSVRLINGKQSQTITFSFRLKGNTAGAFTIGAATVTVKGKALKTKPLKVNIVKGAVAQNPGKSGVGSSPDIQEQLKKLVFVQVIPSKRKLYQGEQLSLTYKLYTRATIAGLDHSPPSFKDFWVEDVEIKELRLKPDVLDGVRYQSVVFKKVILFPQRGGKLRIEPTEIKTTVRVPNQNRRSQSVFDNFFGQYQNVPFNFMTKPITIDVKALPARGKPAGFSGAVGDYKLSASLSAEETQTGNPVTLTLRISGQGNIQSIPAPELDFSQDLEVYEPHVSQRSSRKGGVLSGSKTFDYLILPRNPGSYKLPRVEFSYFDPKKESYQTLRAPEFVLRAEGEALQQEMSLTGLGKEDVELIGEDIRYIQTEEADWREKGRSFAGSLLFWLLYLLPVLAFAGLTYYRRQRQKLLGDEKALRNKKANRMAQKRLTAAKKLMKDGDGRAYYDAISQAIWAYLGDKLGLGQSELMREQVVNTLMGRGVDEALSQRLVKLLDSCEMAVYAPSAVGSSQEELYDEALGLIGDLEAKL